MNVIARWVRKVFRIDTPMVDHLVSIDQKQARAARIKSYRVASDARDLEDRMNAMERVLLCGEAKHE